MHFFFKKVVYQQKTQSSRLAPVMVVNELETRTRKALLDLIKQQEKALQTTKLLFAKEFSQGEIAARELASVSASPAQYETSNWRRQRVAQLVRSTVSSKKEKELPVLSMAEVGKHRSADDCWVVLNGKVYDLTKFHKAHPGGAKLILDAAGLDASKPFNQIHPADIAEKLLGPGVVVGKVEQASVKESLKLPAVKQKEEGKGGSSRAVDISSLSLSQMLNAFDFEAVASQKLGSEAWGYYSSGADDEISLRDNHLAFQRIWFRPRVLVNVKVLDCSRSMLGHGPFELPLYFTATALGRLAHEDGEVAITRAASVYHRTC